VLLNCPIETLREFPSITTILTLTKGCHRLIGGSRLCLCKGHHLLLAFATFQSGTDGLRLFWNHSIVQILLLDFGFLCSLRFRLHFLVGHGCEALWGYAAGENALAQFGVGFVLQVLV